MSAAIDTSPARPAIKGASTELDPALMRRAVDALCDAAQVAGRPLRRSTARRFIRSGLADGLPLRDVLTEGVEALRVAPSSTPTDAILTRARNALGVIDEPGETAARNVDRQAVDR